MAHDAKSWDYLAGLKDTLCRVTTNEETTEIRIYPTADPYPCLVTFIHETAVLFPPEDE